MLQGDQEQLPPDQFGEEEGQHVNQYMGRTNPGAGPFSFCHPIVLQQVIADKMSVYPVHSDSSESLLVLVRIENEIVFSSLKPRMHANKRELRTYSRRFALISGFKKTDMLF
jgi:hypothetical protein